MFDIIPKDPKCSSCVGEGYVLRKMDEIWIGGVKIIPYDSDVWTMCMYCMGTGDNDRRIIENFKYLDIGNKKMTSTEDPNAPPGTAQSHYSIRQFKEMVQAGTWDDWYGMTTRMEQYIWSPDFVKMKEYGKFIMICKEKE